MSNLDKHLQAKSNRLNDLETTLRQIQEQLNLVQQELRVEAQLQKAQQTIKTEFETQKKAFKKLLKDACSCFDQEALDDFVSDLNEIATEVRDEYETHSVSDRFLNIEQAQAEDELEALAAPMLVESGDLPPDGDDSIPLTSHHVEQLLDNLESNDLTRLQSILGLNTRLRAQKKIYQQIATLGITRAKLDSVLSLVHSFKQLSSSNGTNQGTIDTTLHT